MCDALELLIVLSPILLLVALLPHLLKEPSEGDKRK